MSNTDEPFRQVLQRTTRVAKGEADGYNMVNDGAARRFLHRS